MSAGVGRFRRGSAGGARLTLEALCQCGEGYFGGDVVALVRVEMDQEGYPVLPNSATRSCWPTRGTSA